MIMCEMLDRNTEGILCTLFSPIFIYEYDKKSIINSIRDKIKLYAEIRNGADDDIANMFQAIIIRAKLANIDQCIYKEITDKLMNIISQKNSINNIVNELQLYAEEIMIKRYRCFKSYDEMDRLSKIIGFKTTKKIQIDLDKGNENNEWLVFKVVDDDFRISELK